MPRGAWQHVRNGRAGRGSEFRRARCRSCGGEPPHGSEARDAEQPRPAFRHRRDCGGSDGVVDGGRGGGGGWDGHRRRPAATAGTSM